MPVIRNKDHPDLYWSNEFGWVEEGYDLFTEKEAAALNLPIEGVWAQPPIHNPQMDLEADVRNALGLPLDLPTLDMED